MPLPSPAINDSEGLDDRGGAATVNYSTGSSSFTVRTTVEEPGQVGVDKSGHVSIDVTMKDAAGDLFALSGPARAGETVAGDHVSILSPKTGLYVDTESGNTCTVSYTRATETSVVGAAHCDAQTGLQNFTLTVFFHLG